MPLTVLLDTCTLINLLATGEVEAILRSMDSDFVICSAVLQESIYLRSDDDADPPDPIDLGPLIESGALTVCSLESEEEELLYIDYASQLDDGEAMSIAIAIERVYTLATDERKARRLFLEAAGNTDRLLSTAELVHNWSQSEQIPSDKLRITLLRIAQRARFVPRQSDPNYDWWRNACR